MRAAVMYDVDDIRIEERPVPELGPGDVLVRTAASGVCSGDLMPWYVRRKAPFVFGHEPAGTIVATGAGAPFAVGERVFAHHHAPCLACDLCRRGAYVHCARWRASALAPGGMAEYFRLSAGHLVDTLPLPAGMSFADGSLVEPLACVVKSLTRAFARAPRPSLAPLGPDATGNGYDTASLASGFVAERPAERGLRGRSMYVIGAGIMGLMHVAVAQRAGAEVVASDFLPQRREAAERLGAGAAFAPDGAVRELRARFPAGADVVICGPGSPAALAHAVETVAADGTVLMFTPIAPDERFTFDQSPAYFRDVRLVSSYSCGPLDTREALRLIADGVVSADRIGLSRYAFPAVATAYRAMAAAETIKAIVTFDEAANP